MRFTLAACWAVGAAANLVRFRHVIRLRFGEDGYRQARKKVLVRSAFWFIPSSIWYRKEKAWLERS